MGQFSWIDANGKQNIAEEDTVTLLIPQEHIKTAGEFFGVDTVEHGIRGEYDGYGSVVVNNRTVGVEQLYSFLNLCCTSKEQMSDLAERYRYVMSGTGIQKARELYLNGKADTIEKMEELLTKKLKIYTMAQNHNNANLIYPIKITHDTDLCYDDCEFSMEDPNQGFWPYGEGIVNEDLDMDRLMEEIREIEQNRQEILNELRAPKPNLHDIQVGDIVIHRDILDDWEKERVLITAVKKESRAVTKDNPAGIVFYGETLDPKPWHTKHDLYRCVTEQSLLSVVGHTNAKTAAEVTNADLEAEEEKDYG